MVSSGDDSVIMYELTSNSESSENNKPENEDLVEGMGSTAESGVKIDKEVPVIDLTGEPSDNENVVKKTRADPILGTPKTPPVNLFAPEYAHLWDYQPFSEFSSQGPTNGNERNRTSVTIAQDGKINSGNLREGQDFQDNKINQDLTSQNIMQGVGTLPMQHTFQAVPQQTLSYQSGAISVTNGVTSRNLYLNNNGAGPSNLTSLPGVGCSFVTLEDYRMMTDLVNTLNDEVIFLKNEKLCDAIEKDNLSNRERTLEACLVRTKTQVDHIKHAGELAFGHLLSQIIALPSLVPGRSIVEHQDVKNIIEHVRFDYAQNIVNIERLFGNAGL